MNNDDHAVYRLLQRHLDSQAIGFPKIESGADITLLKRLFSPDEARLALHLSYKPAPLSLIVERTEAGFSPSRVEALLESMFAKGAVGRKEKSGVVRWYVLPFVVGMYEMQDGQPTPEFLADTMSFAQTPQFAGALATARPAQFRTIPINESIPVKHHVATYDRIKSIVEAAPGPFVVLKCICREAKAMGGASCAVTSRGETCLGLNDLGAQILRRGHGREVAREEAMEILRQNEKDGLVLEVGNSIKPEFICSCCGCCCGILALHKGLPNPLDIWATNFYAEVETQECTQCGECVSRCQVNAISMTGEAGAAAVDLKRCIGCGVCVPACPTEGLKLRKKDMEITPPPDEEALYDEIMANRARSGGTPRG